MKPESILTPEDLRLLRRPFLILMVSTTVSLLLYLGTGFMNSSATARFQSVQSQFVQVQTSIQQIATEEATFVEYIDRYRMMETDGIFEDEDRLALLEYFQSIRKQARLYPVEIEIGGQGSQLLNYPPEELLPGSPVQLRFSNVDLAFSSLHEDDFVYLLQKILTGRGLFVPSKCEIQKAEAESQFDAVTGNLNSICNLIWFSIDLNPVVGDDVF